MTVINLNIPILTVILFVIAVKISWTIGEKVGEDIYLQIKKRVVKLKKKK